jgi:predicted RNase H-like nuclease (RuvC/YqgF family)
MDAMEGQMTMWRHPIVGDEPDESKRTTYSVREYEALKESLRIADGEVERQRAENSRLRAENTRLRRIIDSGDYPY